MFFILSKVLLYFTYPLTWILVLLILAMIFKRKKKTLLIVAGIVFLVFSNPYLLVIGMKAWEGNNDAVAIPIVTMGEKPFDALVVLGGYSSWNEQHHTVSFNQSSDRILESVRLYKTKSCKKIVLSGGSGLVLKPEEKESIWMKDYLIKLGVSQEDILLEDLSRNTHENAIETKRLIEQEFGGQGRFLLVTSASHMNRAKGCFEKTGLTFEYYRVDFLIDDDDLTFPAYLLPSAIALEEWQKLLKEMIGYLVYLVRGYL